MKTTIFANLLRTAALAAIVLATTGGIAQAWTFRPLYHSYIGTGVPGNEVPGLGGVTFLNPSSAFATGTFGKMRASGDKLAFNAKANLDPSVFDVLVVDQHVVMQRGTETPFAPGQNYISAGSDIGLNAAGTAAFLATTNGPSAADGYVLKSVGGSVSVVAQEGQLTGVVPDAVWGNVFKSPVVTADGRVGFISDNIVGGDVTGSDDSEIAVLGNTLIARNGYTIPGNQFGGATQTWDNFAAGDSFYVSADGNHYILRGDLNGATSSDHVVVVDGNVVIQEGTLLPGMFSPVDSFDLNYMDPAGNWYVAGHNDDGQDWLVRNGEIIAFEFGPVPGRSTVWALEDGELFRHLTGNSAGDFLYRASDTALSPNPNPFEGENPLIVLNNSEVIAQLGDPVDFDGNGLFDDDKFIFFFEFDYQMALADDGTVYFTAILSNGAQTEFGYALLTSAPAVPEPASGVLMLCGAAGLAAGRRRRHGAGSTERGVIADA